MILGLPALEYVELGNQAFRFAYDVKISGKIRRLFLTK